MAKSLIITEKPSVAREFAEVLHVSGKGDGYIENQDYVITWCVGHLVQMVYPERYDPKYKTWRLSDLPFLPKDYLYDVIPSVKKQYDVVHGMLQRPDISSVYWAGDAGKEGQTIEENIRSFGGVRPGMEERRVWIDSQTKEEILRGIREAKPMKDYALLGQSGNMRAIEDYAMGINFSRALSVKYGRMLNSAAKTKTYAGISVGRVMTCVLGLVVERERMIRGFTETPYFRIVGSFGEEGVNAEWKAASGSRYRNSPLLYKENGFKKREDAQKLIDSLQGKPAVLENTQKSTSKKSAPLLFNLAELQAACAKQFHISPEQTLSAAQELYEKKMTTYPRTDCRVLSTAVAKEITKNLSGLRGYAPTAAFAADILDNRRYAAIKKSPYVNDARVTDHYAIIPTGQVGAYESLSGLQKSVYDLIVRRFLSVFYPPAEYETQKIVILSDGERFFVSSKTLTKEGYLAVAHPAAAGAKKGAKNTAGQRKEDGEGENAEEEETAEGSVLSALLRTYKKGEEIPVNGYALKEGKTVPPKRYTSGSMVLAMENAGSLIEDEQLREQIKGCGIGTSATRAEIIEKLVRIGYLSLQKKTQVLTPNLFGEMVYEVVALCAPELLNPKMSASWEQGLCGIADGSVSYADYRKKLEDYIRRQTENMKDTDLRQPLSQRIGQIQKERSDAAQNADQAHDPDQKTPEGRHEIGAVCPLCGGQILTTSFGYGCSRYDYKQKSGCRFTIGKIAGKNLTENQVKTLLTKKKTAKLSGFRSKAGKRFSAALVLEPDGKISFDFSDGAAPDKKQTKKS